MPRYLKRLVMAGLLVTAAGCNRAVPPGVPIPPPPPSGKLLMTTQRAGNREIFQIQADGTGALNLSNSAAWEYDAVWSPDGTKIAFNRSSKIMVMNSDGSGAISISGCPASNPQAEPAWPPDGKNITFSTYNFELVQDGNGNLMMLPPTIATVAVGAACSLISYLPSSCVPSWSPDGNRMVSSHFSNPYSPTYDLQISNVGVTQGVPLTTLPGIEIQARWSPVGDKIAFTYKEPGVGTNVYVVNPDGSGLTALTNDNLSRKPVWSPDGQWIAFTSSREGDDEIYFMMSDGSNVRRFTNSPGWDQAEDWRL